MRIISGTARGVGLEVAKGSSSRPFLEMARGGIFNSLGGLVIGARVLDLYAGSGSLGLEALSRGADACLFVERDPLAFAALLRNIGRCRMGRIARAECAEAGFFLRGAVGAYGLIFVDPPFSICREWTGGGGSGDIPINLVRLMEDDGVLILRLERGVNPPEWPGMSSIDKRCYGRSFVCRYRKSRPGEIGNPEKHPVFGGVPKIGRPGHEPGA